MRIAVIGGIRNLSDIYAREVERCGYRAIVCNQAVPDMRTRLQSTDAIILFTKTVSHQAANVVRSLARTRGVPLMCAHSSGISALKRCLQDFAQNVAVQ